MFLGIIIALAFLGGLVFILVIALPHLCGRLSRIWLAGRCRRVGAVVLTYDDGPGAALTPELLDLLRLHAAKATFFCLGMRAVVNPRVMDLLKSEGHEIACHSFHHRNPWKTTPAKAVGDIREGFEALAGWLSPHALFRPPYGKITLHTWLALMARRARAVWWTHDSGDTWSGGLPSADVFVKGVMAAGGGVVLMHDFDRAEAMERGARHDHVLAVTGRLLEQAGRAGLKVMTLGELLGAEKAAPSPVR